MSNNTNDTILQNQNVNNNASSQTDMYPTAEVLLSVIQKEYDIESSRKRDLETRAGFLIALLGALVGVYVNEINFSYFEKAESHIENFFFILISLFYIFPIVTFLLALKNFISVLTTKPYQRIRLGGFEEKVAKRPKDRISFNLALSYKEAVEKNIEINDTKVSEFKNGIDKLYISLIGIIGVYIIKEFIKIIL